MYDRNFLFFFSFSGLKVGFHLKNDLEITLENIPVESHNTLLFSTTRI